MRTVGHIGIAVKDLKESVRLFSRLLGTSPHHTESVEEQKVHTAMFEIGDTAFELLEPASPDSTIARFIEKRGEGVHHIAIEVDDIVRELERLKADGFQVVDDGPRKGADNCLVAFLHPKSTNGVLIELTQKAR